MNPQSVHEALLALKDIQEPDFGLFVPSTPIWWLLLCLALSAVTLIAWKFYKSRHKRNTIRELNICYKLYAESQPEIFFRKSSLLLRYYFIQRYQTPDIASLTGEAWLALIETKSKHKTDKKTAMAILHAAFTSEQPVHPRRVHQEITQWIKQSK